jgi:hypothetical protein
MQDTTVAGLQSTRVQTPLSLPLLNVMYCMRVSLRTVTIFLATHTKEKGVVGNLYKCLSNNLHHQQIDNAEPFLYQNPLILPKKTKIS